MYKSFRCFDCGERRMWRAGTTPKWLRGSADSADCATRCPFCGSEDVTTFTGSKQLATRLYYS